MPPLTRTGCDTRHLQALHRRGCSAREINQTIRFKPETYWLGGVQVRVAPSQSKHKLYVGNLPKDMSKDDLEAVLQPLVKGAPLPLAALPGFPAASSIFVGQGLRWTSHLWLCCADGACLAVT